MQATNKSHTNYDNENAVVDEAKSNTINVRDKHIHVVFFSLLYRACCQGTQLFYQPLHLYKFIKFTP